MNNVLNSVIKIRTCWTDMRPISLWPRMDIFSISASFSSTVQKLSILFFECEFLFYAHRNQPKSKFYTYFCKNRYKWQPLVLFYWSPSIFLNVIRSNVSLNKLFVNAKFKRNISVACIVPVIPKRQKTVHFFGSRDSVIE